MIATDRRLARFAIATMLAAGMAAALAAPAAAQPGVVLDESKVSATVGGFTGALDDGDRWGRSIANLGDLDGDGVLDLAVTAPRDDDGGPDRGAVWILFMNPDETVRAHQKISSTEGGFGPGLEDYDRFGVSVDAIGDLDGDHVTELAIGAYWADDTGTRSGSVWIAFLETDGTVKATQEISGTEGGFTGDIDVADKFGTSVAALGDLDGDGVPDVAAGAILDDDGGFNRGAVWILFLNADGTVKSHAKISHGNGVTGLVDNDQFGHQATSVPDLDGDGVRELLASAPFKSEGGTKRGAVWVFFMEPTGRVKSFQKISGQSGGFAGPLEDGDQLGMSIGHIGDLDGDGIDDVAIGANGDDDGGTARGAIYMLLMNADGTVKSQQKVSDLVGGFDGELDDFDWFGLGVTPIGDASGDGVLDLVAGAQLDDDGGLDRGALWFLTLDGVPACAADVDRDRTVGFTDLLALLTAFGPYAPCPPHRPEDLDASCDVGFDDVIALLASWGPCAN